MSIYQTPLQFGYFLGLLFAVLLWFRGWQEERLSDKFLGWVMFFLAMEIQDYTFGFSGINILWEKFDGFPRYFHLAFAPTIYFYLKAQINRDFRFKAAHLWHYSFYVVYFMVNFVVFVQGKKSIDAFRSSELAYWLGWLESIAIWGSYIYYFYQSLRLYKEYRRWVETQFSDTETISFVWIRNFIYLIIAGEVFKLSWSIADWALGDLPFEQDWWWHLFTVVIIAYVGIKGYAQHQPIKLIFKDDKVEAIGLSLVGETANPPANPPSGSTNDYSEWKPKIEQLFKEQKLYLEPELSLSDLATKLKTNTSMLSAAINQNFGKNFNDFVNEYRVEEVKRQLKNPANAHLSLLGVAMECGFNSKSTFNRAFKKFTGQSPKEFV
ncbi:helix-turn-helix domain-containing protein [Runella sp. CRIBMP]|uniref:helix-turn-helix domain-containing protein n=1 Tax=Runella sp. CRIBMP TaxID=2683261 RepID=UPI001412E4EE|nr:helix-turn-helix domain-containing protein [Runella sp. CRIBMP]NBB23343.1 helix-turn-helix domain-containing protein [Runella sp. CRIBMP]